MYGKSKTVTDKNFEYFLYKNYERLLGLCEEDMKKHPKSYEINNGIFTTYDGVKISQGEYCYFIDNQLGVVSKMWNGKDNTGRILFSSYKAAKKYKKTKEINDALTRLGLIYIEK